MQALCDKGFDQKFGARPLRRTLQREVEDPLSREILRGRFKEGSVIAVYCKKDKIAFRAKKQRIDSNRRALEPVVG